jgi:hypothetical protein
MLQKWHASTSKSMKFHGNKLNFSVSRVPGISGGRYPKRNGARSVTHNNPANRERISLFALAKASNVRVRKASEFPVSATELETF